MANIKWSFRHSKKKAASTPKKDYDLLIGDIDEDDEAGLLAYNEWKILVQQRFVIDPRFGVQSYPKLFLVVKEMVDKILPDIVKFASNKP